MFVCSLCCRLTLRLRDRLHITDHLRDLGAPLEYDEGIGASDPRLKTALGRVATLRPATAQYAAEWALTPDAAGALRCGASWRS